MGTLFWLPAPASCRNLFSNTWTRRSSSAARWRCGAKRRPAERTDSPRGFITHSAIRVRTSAMLIAMFSWETLHSHAVGGVAAHVTELAAALQRRGHEVHVFT